ncbi:hypothetical protein [Companilactobacillus sp. HBUAS59699]|uniref:hypothetical protein n=1 Tax=Companilactobacillus sp. HBUAS59699 TaxID=3109358 RepID=UPI002FF290B2
MKNVKGIIRGIIFLFAFLAAAMTIGDRVHATPDWYYTDEQAMAVAPEGITIGSLSDPNALFVAGKYTKYMPTISDGHIIQVATTNITNSTSAIWSNNTDNYFDVSQKQTISMWIYMGAYASASQGLVFVLQNGDENAIATDGKGNIVGGETIGVWGDDSTKRSTPDAVAKTAIQKSWALEIDNVRNGGTTFESGERGAAFDSYQINWSPQRSLGEQHVAWGYPGDISTYYQMGNGGLFNDYYYLQNHQDPENLTTRGNQNEKFAWHHVIVTYTPPTDGSDKATLNYKINDKNLKGITYSNGQYIPEGQEQISKNIMLDLGKFKLDGTTKLRFGFTSTSATASVGGFIGADTKVVFETIPGLVQADTNAYIKNKTTSSKIIETDTSKTSNTDPSLFGNNDDLSLASKKTVHPNDKLSFKYLVNYQSGRSEINDAKATISLPDNVKFETDPTKELGKVTYANGDEQVIYGQTPTVGTDNDGNEINNISFDLDDDLGLSNKLATIELYGQAADLPTGTTSLHVKLSHAQINSDQYIADLETKAFDIVAPADTLKITKTSEDPATIYTGQTATLTGDMSFASQKAIDNNDMDIHYSIDGVDQDIWKDTLSPNGSFAINLENLKGGAHEVKVYVVDPNYLLDDGTTDTITSNTLTYTINVESKKLQIASTNDDQLVVAGNADVGIDGTHNYNDNSSFKNDDMTLHTIVNDQETTKQLSGASEITSGNFTTNIEATDLKLGDNPVTIYMTDSDDLKSNELHFTVNVPNTSLILTPDVTDITTLLSETAIMGGTINYSDNASFKNSDITLSISVDGATPYNYALTGDTMGANNHFTHEKPAQGLGDGEHTVTITATDGFGRTSDPVDYHITVIDKSLKLDNDPSYSFSAINASAETRILPRLGDWNLKVESVNSTWALSAQCTDLVETNTDQSLAGGLIYTNKAGAIQSLRDSQVLLASDKTIDRDKVITDVAGQWSQDNGILLKVLPSPVAGNYTGTISWYLTDSL